MREALDPWIFVCVSYALGVGGTALMIGWSWFSMRRAEARRDRAKGK